MAATMALDAAKQIPQAGSQPFGDLFDVDQGQISHAPLNAAAGHFPHGLVVLSRSPVRASRKRCVMPV
jgi:hypothetical protein